MSPKPKPTPETFGSRLRAARKALALSQAEAGARVEPPIDVVRWSKYENGHTFPDQSTVVRIARGLGVAPASLLPE